MSPGGRPARRYAILAEGWFANRHAKTAHGLIAYGRDEIVAVIDSTLASRTQSVLDVLPNLRRETLVESAYDLEPGIRALFQGLHPLLRQPSPRRGEPD